MMQQEGYTLLDPQGNELETWPELPDMVRWPSGDVTMPAALGENNGSKVVERWTDTQGEEDRTNKLSDYVASLQGDKLVRTRTLVPRTQDEIDAWDALKNTAPIETFTPLQIVMAMEYMGIANAVLGEVDELTKAKFYTAPLIPSTHPLLVGALQATGKTMDELKNAVAATAVDPAIGAGGVPVG